MNQFAILDSMFPCGKDRLFGEVVSVSIELCSGRTWSSRGQLYWKRKAWYVNASVNAFHMHRGLCREFSGSPLALELSTTQVRKVKRLFAQIVLNAYLLNKGDGTQYSEYKLWISGFDALSPSERVSAWWVADAEKPDVRELTVEATHPGMRVSILAASGC